jgi:ABC-2 type transport system permease protein
MRNIWTIAKREYDHYFISPIAYVVAVALLFLIGGYFAFLLLAANQQAAQGFGFVPDITDINNLFAFLLLLAIPALTMRLLADETRIGTIELLLTAPVRDVEKTEAEGEPEGAAFPAAEEDRQGQNRGDEMQRRMDGDHVRDGL